MNYHPGITVIIPTYNSEKFLGEAIESVLIQEYDGPKEIIISDDGSCDNTITIASKYGENVKILHKPQNCISQGAAGARNRGIAEASLPFICFLDSDDFYLEGHFKKLSKILNDNPGIGFVFSRVLECKEVDGKRLFLPWTYQKITKQDIKNPVVSRSHIVHTNCFIFKKEVFDKAGIFNENYSNGEDGDMWMRISELFNGKFSDHFGAVYRKDHGDMQLTKNQEEKVKNNSLMIFRDALRRYHELKLRDPFRIFKLKHDVLEINYGQKRRIYRIKYFLLILNYPVSVWYILRDYFYNHQKKRQNVFKDLSFYLKQSGK